MWVGAAEIRALVRVWLFAPLKGGADRQLEHDSGQPDHARAITGKMRLGRTGEAGLSNASRDVEADVAQRSPHRLTP